MLSRTYSTAAQALKILAAPAEGPLSTLSVRMATGSRYAPKAGLAHVLSRFAFQDSQKSALRFAREAELLGAQYSSSVLRDAITIKATFQKEDLPYFVALLLDIVTGTKFTKHEFNEVVLPAVKSDAAKQSLADKALDYLHAAVFRNGLGAPLLYDGATEASYEDVKAFASSITKASVEITAEGVDEAALKQFVSSLLLASLPEGAAASDAVATQVLEARVRSSEGNIASLGSAVKPAEFGKYEALVALLEDKYPVKASVHKYADVGLFSVSVQGEASKVAADIKKVAALLKEGVDVSEYVPLAETKLALANEDVKVEGGVVKAEDFSYVALGETTVLPFKDEL